LNSPTRGGPTRTAVLRGRRSYADGSPTRTAVLRGRRSYADGGPARTAPEGRVPLDSHPSPAGGTGEGVFACAASSYLKEGDGESDSDKFFE